MKTFIVLLTFVTVCAALLKNNCGKCEKDYKCSLVTTHNCLLGKECGLRMECLPIRSTATCDDLKCQGEDVICSENKDRSGKLIRAICIKENKPLINIKLG